MIEPTHHPLCPMIIFRGHSLDPVCLDFREALAIDPRRTPIGAALGTGMRQNVVAADLMGGRLPLPGDDTSPITGGEHGTRITGDRSRQAGVPHLRHRYRRCNSVEE